MSKKGLNRREFLKGGAALTGAALAGGAVGLIEGEVSTEEASRIEWDESTSDKIEDFGKFFRKGKFTEEAKKPVVGAEEYSRHAYLQNYYETTETKIIPPEVQKILASIIPGLAAQESKYDNNARSSVARGVMQIKVSTYNQDYKDRLPGKPNINQFIKSLKSQVKVSFWHFESIYGYLNQKVDFSKFKQKFDLSSGEYNRFITLTMVNAYNCGQGRMAKVLNNFVDHYEAEDIENYNNAAVSLLDAVALFGINSNRKRKKFARGYGKDSSEYVFRALAGNNKLNDFFETDYGLPVSESQAIALNLKEDELRLIDRNYAAALFGVIGGVAGYSAAESLQKPQFNWKSSVGKYAKYPANLGISSGKTAGEIASAMAHGTRSLVTKCLNKGREFMKNIDSTDRSLVKDYPLDKERRKVLAGLVACGVVGGVTNQVVQNGLPSLPSLEGISSPEGTYSLSEVDAEVTRLRKRGIRLYSSKEKFFETGREDARGRTALVGMRKDVWATMEQVLEDLDLLDKGDKSIIVTGLAEGAGHSKRKHGHGGGYSMDLRKESAQKINDALVDNTKIIPGKNGKPATSRQLLEDHPLLESGLVIGEKIFRYNSKYFLFGLEHQGKKFVCYFDAESSHRHMEMIPWEDYNTDNRGEFVKKAKLPPAMKGIWRKEVRDYVRENL